MTLCTPSDTATSTPVTPGVTPASSVALSGATASVAPNGKKAGAKAGTPADYDKDELTSMDTSLFDRFRPVFELDAPPEPQDSRLLMDSDATHDISVYYSPFEYVTPSPKLVLLGTTPGSEQAEQANRALWQQLRTGASPEDALRAAKLAGAFAGEPLRTNLLQQLTDWQIHSWLGFDSAEDILSAGQEQDLVQITSAVRYPTFKSGKVYSGSSPKILDNTVLRRYFVGHLNKEAATWGDALVLPLGKEAAAVANALAARGAIRTENIIPGLLNPSRNNTYRLNWILGDRTDKKPSLTDPASYDQGRERFRMAHIEY